MPRIAGIDVPENKKIRYALRYIYGVGPRVADDILQQCNIEPDVKARDLTDRQVSSINGVIDSGLLVEGALRRQVAQNIQRLKDVRTYRGERHRKGLPVRGQRTRCNARTRKGRKKTVAGKKGVKAK